MKGLIGLEIHTYLVTKEKLFCTCKASRDKMLPNTFVCPVCTGQPGAKPLAPNEEAVKKAVQIGLMLGCTINTHMPWMRKHYSWPDLPKGYQNTLSGPHAVPLGVDGTFEGITITSMHLEEDPASWDPASGYVDYNRSGLPLVEIVTAPDFHFAEEVVEWLNKLVHALSYLKSVDSNAGIKVDVNVNIPGKTERVEIKNINSIDNVFNAIVYELERQSKEGSVRETRRFDEAKGVTMSMRNKEKQDDYRFVVDPDLGYLDVSPVLIRLVEKNLPASPRKKLEGLIKQFKIDKKNAEILAKHLDIVEFFESVASELDPSFVLPWVTVELLRVLHWNKTTLDKVSIKKEHFIALLKMVTSGKITELQAKQLLNEFVPKSFDPSDSEGKIDDRKELERVIRTILKSQPKAVKDYQSGDGKALNFLLGEVMRATQRRADSKVAREVLMRLLG
jgi:aspartyl-tRNA(Asn)/glutamyl-tRNA(Gln) amidotransferase subunit B